VKGSSCCLFQGIIMVFAWRYWGKPQETSVRIFIVLAKIWTGNLPNARWKHYCLSQLIHKLNDVATDGRFLWAYFTILSVSSLPSTERKDTWLMIKWNRFGRKSPWPKWGIIPASLERLTMYCHKILSQDSRYCGQDSNYEPPKCKSTALQLHQPAWWEWY
jgi:hypothetical protein